jgi:hypothetical protein
MSKIVIKNERQLLKFLHVLAEESVMSARDSQRGKAQQARIASDIQKSKRAFMEEEDPPGPTPDASSDQQAKNEPTQQQPAPAPAVEDEPGSISPKFDSLVDAINDLRGSPSTKDSAVEEQLRAYYDKLSSPEAASAILYMKIFAKVMKGEVDGARADDPGDFDIDTIQRGDQADQKEPQTAAPSKPVASSPEPSRSTGSKSPGEENTAPPIKVGGNQVTEAYRKKIKTLLMQQ